MAKSDQDHAVRLMMLARSDIVALRNMLDPASFSEGIFGFHAQQAIEKSLKAWIASRGLEYPKSHDLSALMRMLAAADVPLTEFQDLVEFSVFGVQYRYELYPDPEDLLDRPAVIEKIASLMDTAAEAIGITSPKYNR